MSPVNSQRFSSFIRCMFSLLFLVLLHSMCFITANTLCAYCVPGGVLSASHTGTNLIFTTALEIGYYYHFHFIHKEVIELEFK